ncbi:MAG: hypothetical protein AMJ46_12635 [Latescibacteria bacterium DG_63]|nr:MAG: hypothetical protein AMJ46_12635 [Latescibacteria bacterium DG_63]
MAHTKARLGMVAVSAAGSSYTDVGGLISVDYDEGDEAIDSTDFDSEGNKEVVGGEKQSTLSLSFHRDEADSGQDIIRTAKQAGNLLYFRVRPYEAGSADQFIAQFLITSLKNSSARNALVECSLEAQSSGAITHSTQ